jgi:hypothetical protein
LLQVKLLWLKTKVVPHQLGQKFDVLTHQLDLSRDLCSNNSTGDASKLATTHDCASIRTPAMDKKRKLPARGTRESASKKRASTPPELQTPQVAPSPPAVVQEPLPKKLVSGEPLPTVAVPQPDDLNGFQTISER